jgi:hypothetical protein
MYLNALENAKKQSVQQLASARYMWWEEFRFHPVP